MGDTVPGGKYIGIDGKLHNAHGARLNRPKQKAKPKGKKAVPAAKKEE